jgi:hypothetical protein
VKYWWTWKILKALMTWGLVCQFSITVCTSSPCKSGYHDRAKKLLKVAINNINPKYQNLHLESVDNSGDNLSQYIYNNHPRAIKFTLLFLLDLDFQRYMSQSYLVFKILRWEGVVHFVGIGGIAVLHCLICTI